MTDRDQRIRETAYFLWLEEGCPEGEADRHWLTAEGLVESELRRGKSSQGETPDGAESDSRRYGDGGV
jgi:Protein of unknown function (DUF2934)